MKRKRKIIILLLLLSYMIMYDLNFKHLINPYLCISIQLKINNCIILLKLKHNMLYVCYNFLVIKTFK